MAVSAFRSASVAVVVVWCRPCQDHANASHHADDRLAVFDATGSTRKTLAVFSGGSHSIFTDRAASGGMQLNAQIKEATRELSLAFLHSVFGGDDAALAAWPGQFAGIVARYTRHNP